MISCKDCPDKMKCLTGNVKDCRRGFMLKRCCRRYLTNRRKHLLRTILNMPEEMVKNNIIEIREVCSSCGEKINFSIRIKPGLDVFPTFPLPEPLPNLPPMDQCPQKPYIEPYIWPNQPYQPNWEQPYTTGSIFADDNTTGITLRAESIIKKGTYEKVEKEEEVK